MMEATRWYNRYVLLSWKLWKHLLYPRENAVFERVITQNPKQRLTIYHLSLLFLAGGILSYGVISFLRPLGTDFPIIAVIVLAVFSSIITIRWLVAIIENITHEHQHATYDLLCITPLGKMGVNLSIVTGTLHQQDIFRWIDSGRRWLSGLTLLIFLSVLVPIILSTVGDNRNSSFEGMILFLDVVGFVVITYVEYIQSVLLGVLIAIAIPQFIRRTGDGTVWAIFVFITLQIVTITIFLVMNIFTVYIFRLNDWQYLSILPQLLLFFAMREGCIYTLWKRLSHQLNAESDDIQQI